MRVLFASTHGAGHFGPLVPFVDACLRKGHDVLVTGPPTLDPRARSESAPRLRQTSCARYGTRCRVSLPPRAR